MHTNLNQIYVYHIEHNKSSTILARTSKPKLVVLNFGPYFVAPLWARFAFHMQINRPQCSHSVDKFSILNGVQVFLCQLLLILIGIHLSIYPSIHPFIHLSILFVAYVFSFFSARLSVWFHFNYYTRLLPPTRFYLYKFFTLAVIVLFGFLFRDKARYTNELWLWL